MDKRLLSIGLVVLIVGIFLLVAFWPIFTVSAEELADDRDGGQFQSYDEGDTVRFVGDITDIGETNLPEWMREIGLEDMVHIEIDGKLSLVLIGETDIDFKEGDQIYGTITLQEQELPFGAGTREFWKIESKDEISSKRSLDYIFFAITGLGIAVTAAGAVKV
ncbi:MAG: hypothetical protein ACOC85_00795 [Thermoplasmatota archaeon]